MEFLRKLKPTLTLQQAKTATLLTLPIILHTCYFSLLDLLTVGTPGAPPSIHPDMASLLFVTATTTLTSRALAKNRPPLPRTTRNAAATRLKQLLLTGLELFSNVALCELALRTVWIPVQYLLHYLKDQQLLAVLVRKMFCGLSYWGSGSELLSEMHVIASGEAGYFIARNVVASGYLLVVLVFCGYLGQVWRRIIRR